MVVVVAFSLHARIFWSMFDKSFPTCTFFFKVEISLHTNSTL